MSDPLVASTVIVLAFSAFPLFLGQRLGRYTREQLPLSDRIALIVIGVGILAAEVFVLWLYLSRAS